MKWGKEFLIVVRFDKNQFKEVKHWRDIQGVRADEAWIYGEAKNSVDKRLLDAVLASLIWTGKDTTHLIQIKENKL